MVFEHFALNVPDAVAAADWYVRHLGFRIVRAVEGPPFTRFLADETGRTVLEVYTNPAAPVPDYARQHWLVVHFALVSPDVDADRARLEAAGAKLATIDNLPDGSRLAMMRDPWGVCVQLCQRAQPLPR
jgi:catechol 2,3-dioxygenase-like lactoylglutathione lyase family enzyme